MLIRRGENVDAASANLVGATCERVARPRDRDDWEIRVTHLGDPDGNLVEINQPLGW